MKKRESNRYNTPYNRVRLYSEVISLLKGKSSGLHQRWFPSRFHSGYQPLTVLTAADTAPDLHRIPF
jgi:hypothetical protein